MPAQVFDGAHFVDVTVAPSGWIAAGFRGGQEPGCCEGNLDDHSPAAWYSPNGETWRSAYVVDANQDIGWSLGQLFVGADGIVADVGPGPGRWTSSDGRRWSRTEDNDSIPSPAASDGTHIIGYTIDVARRFQFAMSTDGVTWRGLDNLGSLDEAPNATRAQSEWINVARLLPTGVAILGENAADEFPIWFAAGVE